MKIARCIRDSTPIWPVVNDDEGLVWPFPGAFAEWAPPRITAVESSRALSFTGETWKLKDVHLLPPAERGATVYVAGANYSKQMRYMHLEGAW
jgi:hypothetical protein